MSRSSPLAWFMSLHVPLPGRGEEGGQEQPGDNLGRPGGRPAPSHWVFGSREKWKPEESQGKAIRGRVTGARRREWVAEGEGGKKEVAEEIEAVGSDEARDLSRGGAG